VLSLADAEAERTVSLRTATLAADLRISVARLRRRLVAEPDRASLSLGAMAVLGALGRYGRLSVGELAARERVRTPSMTRTLNCLERQGIVRREPHPHDGRVVVVGLTDQGRHAVGADRAARDAWLAQQLRALAPEEREVLRRAVSLLERLARCD